MLCKYRVKIFLNSLLGEVRVLGNPSRHGQAGRSSRKHESFPVTCTPDSRDQLSAACNSAFDTCVLAFVFVAFVRPHLSDSTFSFDDSLAILLSLLDTRVAINFCFVWNESPVL